MEDEFIVKNKKPAPMKKRPVPDSPTFEHVEKKGRLKAKEAIKKAKPKMQKSNPTPSTSDAESKLKVSTGKLVNQALEEMNSRKGSSIYAIMKFILETHKVDPKKSLVKKYIKAAIEKGVIVQTKGIGASGSFKLDTKKKAKKPEKKLQKKTDKEGKITRTNKTTVEKKKKELKDKQKKDAAIIATKKKDVKVMKEKEDKKKDVKFSKSTKSPKKKPKLSQPRRRSVGSIVKPPKMKPKTPSKPKTVKQKKA